MPICIVHKWHTEPDGGGDNLLDGYPPIYVLGQRSPFADELLTVEAVLDPTMQVELEALPEWLDSGDRWFEVPDDEVPAEVWAELAKRRLQGELP